MRFDDLPEYHWPTYLCPIEGCGGTISVDQDGVWECDKCNWTAVERPTSDIDHPSPFPTGVEA